MTTPKVGVTVEELQELLRVVGQWGDVNRHGQCRDQWSWFVTTLDNYYGYISVLEDRRDHVRSRWSTIAIHDGDDRPTFLQRVEDNYGTRHYFHVPGASFALIEHQRRDVRSYVPERLFIYPYAPAFSARRVIERLEQYRRAYPANIFLLPTTIPKKKGKKK